MGRFYLLQLLLLFTYVPSNGELVNASHSNRHDSTDFLFGRHSVPCYNLSYKLGFGGNAYGT